MIDLVFKNYTNQKSLGRVFFEKILKVAVRELELKGNFGISVNLVGEKEIQELNKKYRGKDKSTDVLSFPIGEDLEIRNSKFEIDKDIGDIFICLSIAKKEAKRENITIKDKLAQLTVHGFLHLQGYDHERSRKDAKEMFRLEDQILAKLRGL